MNVKTRSRRGLLWLFVTAAAFLLITSLTLYRQNDTYARYIENANKRAFSELGDSISDINSEMSKAVLTTDPRILNQIAHKITADANYAKSALGQLPLDSVRLDNMQKFLAQVGDFTIYISDKTQFSNEKLSGEDIKTMKELLSYADKLSSELSSMEEEYLSQALTFDMAMRMSAQANAKGADINNQNSFTKLENEFQDYPSLIYDGPFSEHLENEKPRLLEEKAEISEKDAESLAKKFIGEYKIKDIKSDGESQNTAISAYAFHGKLNDDSTFSVEVTKRGGEILWYLSDKDIKDIHLSMEQIIEKGTAFFNSVGKNNMKNSYYELKNNILTINYFPVENDVFLYPDLIKLRISQEDGEILGYEAKGYIMNHKTRAAPSFSDVDVKKYINSEVSYESVTKALIPTDGGKEIYCYEVKGKLDKRDYLIYLNAENGGTERILLLLENENGILVR